METNTEIKLLQVGDVLYNYSRWHGLVRYEIDRISNKQAFSGVNKFKREIEIKRSYIKSYVTEYQVRFIGEYGYADLETEELKNNYAIQQTMNKASLMFGNFRFDKNIKTKEDAEKLIEFLSSFTKKEETT